MKPSTNSILHYSIAVRSEANESAIKLIDEELSFL